MASRRTSSVLAQLTWPTSGPTPYIARLIEDAKLRANVQHAFESSKRAYERLSSNGKSPHRALVEDKKLQHELRDAVESLREVSIALSEAPKRQVRKKRRVGRKVVPARAHRWDRAGGEREAALEGARHAVRRGGGVRVHAAAATGSGASREPRQLSLAAPRRLLRSARGRLVVGALGRCGSPGRTIRDYHRGRGSRGCSPDRAHPRADE